MRDETGRTGQIVSLGRDFLEFCSEEDAMSVIVLACFLLAYLCRLLGSAGYADGEPGSTLYYVCVYQVENWR